MKIHVFTDHNIQIKLILLHIAPTSA